MTWYEKAQETQGTQVELERQIHAVVYEAIKRKSFKGLDRQPHAVSQILNVEIPRLSESKVSIILTPKKSDTELGGGLRHKFPRHFWPPYVTRSKDGKQYPKQKEYLEKYLEYINNSKMILNDVILEFMHSPFINEIIGLVKQISKRNRVSIVAYDYNNNPIEIVG